MRIRRIVLALALALLSAAIVTVGVDSLGAALTPRPARPATEAVLLIGDSLLHQAAPGITAALPGSSVVEEAVPGSGLLDGDVDWFSRAQALVEQYHPDVVVVSFVGNYDASAGTLVADTPAYYAAWDDAAQRLTDLLRASGTRVDWVAQPPLRDPNFYGLAASRTSQLYLTYAALARQPGVALLDANDSIAAADGSFAEAGPVCGTTVTLRIADGVHFTDAGADWWGVHVGRAVAQLDTVATRDACTAMQTLAPGV